MKEIVILSGKGGTGKTSVAASLAVLAGSEAVIADCDVDAANMHLLLKPDYKQGSDFFSGELAVINTGLCVSCGVCAEICRFDAIGVSNNTYRVDPFDCEGCGYCEKVCPAAAITLVPRKTGKLYISDTRAENHMVHATMVPGAENSGKLVTRVKQEARDIAEREDVPFIIVDGSPGLGCPVVASLSGASLVLLVTEPTISALHDLMRVNQVIKNFRIKTACIINKYDLNPGKSAEILDFLRRESIDHVADIPYDSDIARAMADALTMAESKSAGSTVMKNIWTRIKTEIINK